MINVMPVMASSIEILKGLDKAADLLNKKGGGRRSKDILFMVEQERIRFTKIKDTPHEAVAYKGVAYPFMVPLPEFTLTEVEEGWILEGDKFGYTSTTGRELYFFLRGLAIATHALDEQEIKAYKKALGRLSSRDSESILNGLFLGGMLNEAV